MANFGLPWRWIHRTGRPLPLLAQGCLVILLFTACCNASDNRLADAAEAQDAAAIERHLQEKADVNAAQADGTTPLHWAVYHDDIELARRLLQHGAIPDARNDFGITPLALGCINGSSRIVELLLEHGADAQRRLAGGETMLMLAARTGEPGPVAALLHRGADVNATEKQGQTALMWAAAEGNAEAVSQLLQAGADLNKTLPSGFNAFFFAIREGRANVVEQLIAAGADVHQLLRSNRPGQTASKASNGLLLATENGHFELASRLLEHGAEPNDRPAGYTALHALTWVRKPIRGDGDPPPIGSGSITSLQLVDRLAAKGADVNARQTRGDAGRGQLTLKGATPFFLAARTGDVPLMNRLLELGADWSIPNADRTPPLLAAAGVGALGDGDETAGTEADAIAAIRLILDCGADVNAVDAHGETAMHGAAYQSWPEVARLLVEQGADAKVWHQENEWGWTPLLIAEGHRPGNFRPAPATIEAIRDLLLLQGIQPPAPSARPEGQWRQP